MSAQRINVYSKNNGVQAIRLAYKDLAFDPIVSAEDGYLTGIYMRTAGDAFDFKPLPHCRIKPSFDVKPDDGKSQKSGFHTPIAPRETANIPGIHIALGTQSNGQSLILPVMGSEHDVRIPWGISTSSNNHTPLATIDRPNSFVKLCDDSMGQGSVLDLTASKAVKIQIAPGNGFAIGTHGDIYPFILLFRLVSCNCPIFVIELKLRNRKLELHYGGSRNIQATFVIRPSPMRNKKTIHAVSSAEVSLSDLAVVVYEPFFPRFFLDISGALSSCMDRPLSRSPFLGRPSSSFPIMAVGTHAQITWPIQSISSNNILAKALSGIVFIGDSPRSHVEAALRSKKIRHVGIIATSSDALQAIVPVGLHTRLSDSDQLGRHFHYRGKSVCVLLITDTASSWRQLDDFFSKMIEYSTYEKPQSFQLAWKQHMSARLPSLPFCRDLAVCMALAVGCRQRGRPLLDRGGSEVDYEKLADNSIWLSPWDGVVLRDRDDLILEIALRTTAEYLAVRTYSELMNSHLIFKRDLAHSTPNSLADAAMDFTSAWEQEEGEKLAQKREQMLYAMTLYDTEKTLTLPALASAFLIRFRRQLTSRSEDDVELRRINPLVLVLATGDNMPYDISLEFAACFWANYAAGLSGAKPGAIVASFLPKSDIAEALRRQEAIRVAISHLDRTNELHLLDVRIKRQDFGTLVLSKLTRATMDLLRAADADRIVACSSLMLDFVPFGHSILGLERPMSRLPVCEDRWGDFSVVNSAALSSHAEIIGNRQAAMLFPSTGRDRAEQWASSLCNEIAQTLPMSGYIPSLASANAMDIETVIDIVRNSELVIFAGHAWSNGNTAAINLGNLSLTIRQLEDIDWTGKVAILIGCETATHNSGDLAQTLLKRGARAILGTTTEIEIEPAQAFVNSFLDFATAGAAIDYAFFLARREAVVAEAMAAKGQEWDRAAQFAREIVRGSKGRHAESSFPSLLIEAGLTWEETYTAAVFSLSWSLTGGVAENLR